LCHFVANPHCRKAAIITILTSRYFGITGKNLAGKKGRTGRLNRGFSFP